MSEPRQELTLTTVTSTHLLDGLKDSGNRTVWRHYVDRYRPLVVAYACRVGMDRADAEDIAQQSLVAFATAYQDGKYDRDRGRLRHWLFGIVRKQLLNRHRKRRRREVQVAGSGSDETDFFQAIGGANQLEEVWEQQWREAVIHQVLQEIRHEVEPKTIQAFELFAFKEWSAQQVAKHLDITPNAVFGAKRRVLHRIREVFAQVEEIW